MSPSSALMLLLVGLSENSFSQDPPGSNQRCLEYVQPAFDSDTCCWRQLNASGHYLEAAELIVIYLQHRKKNFNQHALHWHAGQMFAMAQKNDLAIHYFKRTYSPWSKWLGGPDSKTWYFYAKGTVAFLHQDKKKLHYILTRWSKKFPEDVNYEVLQALYENIGKKYADVFTHL